MNAEQTNTPLKKTPLPQWAEQILDVIDNCNGLTLEQDAWLSMKVREIAREQMKLAAAKTQQDQTPIWPAEFNQPTI